MGVTTYGDFLSSEELGPRELLEQARRAEHAGFHGVDLGPLPPVERRAGQSPFVWSISARSRGHAAAVTTAGHVPDRADPPGDRRAGRRHHGRAAAAASARGRQRRGAQRAHPRRPLAAADVRLEMLEEAVEVIRLLQEGRRQPRRRHYTVENARIYTLPDEPPPIRLRRSGRRRPTLAGRIGDGFC